MLPSVTGEFRIVADPELRYAPSGVAVCGFRAVASKRKKDDSGEWVDDKTCWVKVTSFKKLAENVAESDFKKGDLVVVTGRLHTEEWEDREGNKRTSIEVTADHIAPSLTFNPTRLIRSERSGGQAQRSSAPAEDPWQTPAPSAPPASDEPPF